MRLTFLHWKYDPVAVQSMLPAGLTVDTFDGAAWVGLTPFLLSGLRLPHVPALPWISRFPETNVRTYARGPDGTPGVWFFSLDAARVLAVTGARAAYRLPYMWSRMRVEASGTRVEYQGGRIFPRPRAGYSIAIEPGMEIHPGDRDHFLTARWRLYTKFGKQLAFAQVEHPPWPLYAARVLRLEQNLLQCAGLPAPRGEPIAHYSPGVDARVSRPQGVGR